MIVLTIYVKSRLTLLVIYIYIYICSPVSKMGISTTFQMGSTVVGPFKTSTSYIKLFSSSQTSSGPCKFIGPFPLQGRNSHIWAFLSNIKIQPSYLIPFLKLGGFRILPILLTGHEPFFLSNQEYSTHSFQILLLFLEKKGPVLGRKGQSHILVRSYL